MLEGCADEDGLNSHGKLPHYSPSDSIMERDLSGERVFINPPWELAEHVGRHFESCRRTTPTSTMVVFALPKAAFYINPQLQNLVPGTVYELFYRDIQGSAHLNNGVSYKYVPVDRKDPRI
jgi:hypothetical protein